MQEGSLEEGVSGGLKKQGDCSMLSELLRASRVEAAPLVELVEKYAGLHQARVLALWAPSRPDVAGRAEEGAGRGSRSLLGSSLLAVCSPSHVGMGRFPHRPFGSGNPC